MGFSRAMRIMLKNNPNLRAELFALKKATVVKEGLQPTAQAKKIVRNLDRAERQVLDSAQARTAFDQTVKPECRPYQPLEDCFNRGYLEEPAFLADKHNARTFQWYDVNNVDEYMGSYENPGKESFAVGNFIKWLKEKCTNDGTRKYIGEMKAIRAAQGEQAGSMITEGLTIKVPKPKIQKPNA